MWRSQVLNREVRQVEYFDSINIRGAYTTKIICQMQQSVKLKSTEDILTLIKTEVKNNILFIFPQIELPKDTRIKIEILANDLKNIDVSGANHLEVNNLKNQQTNINFDGSSNSKISGETKDLNVIISGQAKLNARQFSSQKVNLDLSGSVMAEVYANQELNIAMNGAGAIYYHGEPKTQTRNIQGPVFIGKK